MATSCRYEILEPLELVVSIGNEGGNVGSALLVPVSAATLDVPSLSAIAHAPFSFSGRATRFFPFLKSAKEGPGIFLAAATNVLDLHVGSGAILVAELSLPTATIEGVSLTCDELVASRSNPAAERTPLPSDHGVLRFLDRERVALFAEPPVASSKRFVTLAHAHDMPLFELETREGASHVAYAWSDGTRIDGWIESAALRLPQRCERDGSCDEATPVLHGISSGYPTHNWETRGFGKQSRAHVTSKTPVFALPGRYRWTTTVDESLAIYTPAATDEWVRVVGPRSEAAPELGAWVSRAAVKLLVDAADWKLPKMGQELFIDDELSVARVAADAYVITARTFYTSNVLVVRMPDRTVVICSSPFESDATRTLVAWVNATLQPTRIIAINTHFHRDGTGGNEAFRALGVTSYASELTQRLLREKGEPHRLDAAQGFKDEDKRRRVLSTALVPADHTFDAREGLDLSFAGEHVRVIHPGAAHSPDNVLVFFPTRALLFGGCMIKSVAEIGYVGDADLVHWEAAVEVARALHPDVVVPGHGAVGGRELFDVTVKAVRRAR